MSAHCWADTRKRGGAETPVACVGAGRAFLTSLHVAGVPRKSGGYPVIRESHKATCTAALCQELAFYQG